MSDAQARKPSGCAPPLAADTGTLAEEDAACIAHADTLRRWVEDLQELIGGEAGGL